MSRNKTQDYNAPFPTALRELLKEQDKNQGNIATITGKTRQTVSQYVNGISEPSYKTLVDIADYLNVSTDYLLGRTTDPSRSPCAADSLGLSAQAVQIIQNIRTLKNSADILAGLSIILEDSNMIFVAQEVMALKKAVQSQIDHTKHLINTQQPQKIPRSISQRILSNDMDIADSLKEELEKQHPELQNIISVACGQAALDIAIQAVTESFATSIKLATGYFDYQLKTMDIGR